MIQNLCFDPLKSAIPLCNIYEFSFSYIANTASPLQRTVCECLIDKSLFTVWNVRKHVSTFCGKNEET